MLTGEAMWRLLRAVDEPGNPEIPHDYDHDATRCRFLALAARLDTDFGCRTDRDLWVQDAALHARLDIPEAATRGGEKIYVAVSNFASLAIAGPCNPDAYDSEERDVYFEAEDRRLVETALADLGYRLVDEPKIWEPYDGINTALRPEITWGGRFFDYL
ncbi:hypothetical protein AB0F91_41990 [Amycolatopsis sp. NPDC023774]|uniref:hypothetical protein n=1 Tax=Amycolatopsis sp. NPDC023774 TaxID=3155015 RepID=UPI0033F212FD